MENTEPIHSQAETHPTDDERRFGVCLKRIRLKLDAKQAWLSMAVGCTEAAISLWEKGARVPTARSFGLLLAGLAEVGVVNLDLLELRRLWLRECTGRRLARRMKCCSSDFRSAREAGAFTFAEET
jgi:transcriptional regulator with XRE-family HTH domain